jgi:MPBQ/MSBQ methyltransferase
MPHSTYRHAGLGPEVRHTGEVDSIARHYAAPGLLDRILRALDAQGKRGGRLAPRDLTAVDEFHLRGRQATLELAELAGVRPEIEVLDVGSGLGGSARFLAESGCRVAGLDLSLDYCAVAAALSRLTSLDRLTRFCCASALEMPFASAGFDLVWTQHVQMNIHDKPGLYREIRRVLRPGGRFVLHDILAGPGGPPHFPVHWAETPAASFLIAPDDLRDLLEASGFRVLAWHDTTEAARTWYLAAMERRRQNTPPELGLHLLMGPAAEQKFANLARNLLENRLAVFQGACAAD